MASYYTIDSIRDHVLQNGWTINSVYFTGSQRAVDIADSFPSDWNYCHCNTLPLCINRNTKTCIVRIGISTSNPSTSLFIEVIYIRGVENGIGVVRTNQMLLKSYIDNGRINVNLLQEIII